MQNKQRLKAWPGQCFLYYETEDYPTMHYTQNDAPLYEAMKNFRQNRVVPFDVPGHKGGRGNEELTEFLGVNCLKADVNSMKPLDNLCHPVSVIKDAQELAAEAFGAAASFFIVNGTTGSVQAMIMSSTKEGDKIIMPRNVHRSAINALVVNGAKPVYVNPGVNNRLGIPLGMSVKDVEKAIEENPDAKAVLINNPTYYGVCSDLKSIVDLAHRHGMLALVDEAHGTHLYFGKDMPLNAMAAGADMAAVSMHKSGGSLTQSSILLLGPSVNEPYVRQVINLTQTTSASYLLMSSLDIARKNLALNGAEIFAKATKYAQYARDEINRIGGDAFFDFDRTKLSVNTFETGLAGVEVYDLLRDKYNIQIEFGDIGNILAYISAGDRALEIERLISALAEIKRRYSKDKSGMFDHEYIKPDVSMTPKKAFFSSKEKLELEKCEGKICGEFVMCYPPGIPILAPGERITKDIIGYILYAKEKGCFLTGTQDMEVNSLQIVTEE